MVILCTLEMSYIGKDCKNLLTQSRTLRKTPVALWIRNMLVHQIPEKIPVRDREPVGNWRTSVKILLQGFVVTPSPFSHASDLCFACGLVTHSYWTLEPFWIRRCWKSDVSHQLRQNNITHSAKSSQCYPDIGFPPKSLLLHLLASARPCRSSPLNHSSARLHPSSTGR